MGVYFSTTQVNPDRIGDDDTFSVFPLARGINFERASQGVFEAKDTNEGQTSSYNLKSVIWAIDPLNFTSEIYPNLNYLDGDTGEEYLWSEDGQVGLEDCGMPDFVPKGELYGIQIKKMGNCMMDYFNSRFDSPEDAQVDFYAHAGGGAIGQINYLLHNVESSFRGSTYDLRHSEADRFARRWARYVIKDFLCREVPIYDGGGSYAKSESEIYEKHTFLLNGSCMNCHATLDGMSATLRNVAVKELGNGRYMENGNVTVDSVTYNEFSNLMGTRVLSTYDPSKCKSGDTSEENLNNCSIRCQQSEDANCPSTGYYVPTAEEISGNKIHQFEDIIWPDPDQVEYAQYFSRVASNGHLVMDDIDGTTITNEDISGVNDLGEALSDTLSFYGCAVHRYMEFLTGYNIPLVTEDELEDLGDEEKAKFEFVKGLAERFKNGDNGIASIGGIDLSKKPADSRTLDVLLTKSISNLQELVKEIIISDYFMESVIGTEEAATDSDSDSDSETETKYVSEGTYNISTVKLILASEDHFSSDDHDHNCLQCHGDIADDGWDIDDFVDSTWPNGSGNKAVTIGDDGYGSPCDSQLYIKLIGNDCTTGTMPTSGDQLTEGELGIIKSWIENIKLRE